MAEYAVTITFAFVGEQPRTLILDTVDDVNVQSSSTITQHPLPTGEYAADHMYNNPTTMTINGMTSLNGSKTLVVDGEGTKLENIQALFERIKSEGILCDIVKIRTVDNKVMFMHRTNMALQNISWTERINSLGFNFTFRQIIAVDVQEYEVDISDEFAPSVTEPATLSFTDALIDWDKVHEIVISEFIKQKFVSEAFVNSLASAGSAALIAFGVSAVIAKSVVSIAVACGASGPIGWIALAVVGAVTVIAGLIAQICKAAESDKFKEKQFEYYEDDRKNQQEIKRFCNFMGEIHTHIEQLNTAMLVYQISSNEPQECMLTIGNNYYIFKFTKNNTSGKYGLKVYDVNEVEKKVMSDISGALQSFYECTSQNYLFRADETGEYVYLINTSIEELERFERSHDLSNLNQNEKAEYEELKSLENYMILVSAINPEKFNEALQNIILNAILA